MKGRIIGWWKFVFMYEVNKRAEMFAIHLASKAPKKLRYYLTLDACAKATCGQYGSDSPCDVNIMTLLKRTVK